MLETFDLIVNLKKVNGNDVFAKTYRIALWDEFVGNNNPKGHGFISNVEGFLTQLKLNSLPLPKLALQKRQIYTVNFGVGVGSQITGVRPALVYKNSDDIKGEDVILIPLTTDLQDRRKDKYDILVPKDEDNKLYTTSRARLRQMKGVSLKAIGKFLGVLTNENVKQTINEQVQVMLATDK